MTSPPSSELEHFVVLDSLRGVAALTVVVWHLVMWLLFVPEDSPYQAGAQLLRLIQLSPLYPLMAGREAVIIFFILSGFVLSLPWLRRKDVLYGSYLTKRICRIYIPYIVTVALAFAAYILFAHSITAEISSWFDGFWTHPPTASDVAQHVLLIGSFDNEQYAIVLWSLVHEMRISIIFPLLMVVIVRQPWQFSLGFFLVLSIIGIVLDNVTGGVTDYPETIHFLIFFVAGALLAKHRGTIIGRWRKLPRPAIAAILSAMFVLYTYGRVFSQLVGESIWAQDTENLFVGVGAVLLIIWLLSSTSVKRVMETGALVFLGRISYSLYLLHPIVLLSLVHMLSSYVNIYVLLMAVLPISLALATLSYEWVERPATSLGRRLTSSMALSRSRNS